MRGSREYKGDIKCGCGKDAPVYLTGGGMLTYSCGWCRVQVHAPAGSAAQRAMLQKITAGQTGSEKIQQQANQKPESAKPQDTSGDKGGAAVAEKTIFDIFKG